MGRLLFVFLSLTWKIICCLKIFSVTDRALITSNMDGNLMEPSCYNPQGQLVGGGWQGMSIKDILEKVDLFNFGSLGDEENGKKKDKTNEGPMTPDLKLVKPEPNVSSAKSAFLGPKIWKNSLHFHKMGAGGAAGSNGGSMDASGTEFSVMNIDEFLNENNLDFDHFPLRASEEEREQGMEASTNYRNMYRNPSSVASGDGLMEIEQPISPPVEVVMPQSPSRNEPCLKRKADFDASSPQLPSSNIPQWNKSKSDGPKGKNDFLYVESKRARLEREREERRRREEVRCEFSAEELALATIPGADFDPARRQFSLEELKPQPIIRKKRKSYVSPDRKDEKYWEKRGKNNVAARRSREARRLKENQISLRTAFLEQQNSSLKSALNSMTEKNEKLSQERKALIEKLKKYESVSPFLDDQGSAVM